MLFEAVTETDWIRLASVAPVGTVPVRLKGMVTEKRLPKGCDAVLSYQTENAVAASMENGAEEMPEPEAGVNWTWRA